MGILKSQSPVQIFKLFHVSERSSRLLLPKFLKSKIMCNNFIYNASKILNFLYDNDIPYSIFRKRQISEKDKFYFTAIEKFNS